MIKNLSGITVKDAEDAKILILSRCSFARFASFAVKTYSLGCLVSTCLAIASAKPSTVYSMASMFGLKPA
jgi:hypothetical protein